MYQMDEIWIVVAVVIIIGIIAVIILFTITPKRERTFVAIKDVEMNKVSNETWQSKLNAVIRELTNNVENAKLDGQLKMSSAEEKAIEDLCNCFPSSSDDCGANTNSQLWSMLRLRHQTLYHIMNLGWDDSKPRDKLTKYKKELKETNKEINKLIKCYTDNFDNSFLEKVDNTLILHNTARLSRKYQSRTESLNIQDSDSEGSTSGEAV